MFIQGLLSKKENDPFIFHYIEDILSLEKFKFSDRIHHEAKYKTDRARIESYLDLHLESISENKT